MRVLGIDPGTALLGWGVLDVVRGTLQAVDYGVLKTSAEDSLARRLLYLHRGMVALLEQYQPDAVAVEELFFSRNARTALAVGHARGVVLLTMEQGGIAIYEYKPLAVKQALTGYGGADKRQMQEMVRLTLSLSVRPRPDDAADALAIAICHAYTAPLLGRLSE